MKKSVYSVLLICFSVALFGCPSPKKTKVPTYEEARAQALKEAPFTLKPVEERNQDFKCDEKPKPVQKIDHPGLPHSGLLFSAKKAECLQAQIAERKRLRTELEAERLRARTKQIINDAAYKRLAEETRSTWWDRNGGSALFATGAAVGMAIVLGVMYAITGGKSVDTNANSHIISKP
jgi:hypothetical protein